MEGVIDVLESGSVFVMAGKRRRLVNFIVDGVLALVFIILVGVILFELFYNWGIEIEEDSKEETIMGVFLFLLGILFYTVQEYALKGKTIGKYLTKTRAVTVDHTRMGFWVCAKRNTIRLVLLGVDPFTFLGRRASGWHDLLSHSKVVLDNERVKALL